MHRVTMMVRERTSESGHGNFYGIVAHFFFLAPESTS